MSVFEAVKRDLSEYPPAVAKSALAASALELARLMDGNNSATSKAICAKALQDTLDRLRELSPPKEKADGVDDLNAQRVKRRRRAGT